MKSLFDLMKTKDNPLIAKMTEEQIINVSKEWGKYLTSDQFILTSNNIISGVSAVGLIYGRDLLNIIGNTSNIKLQDDILYKIILHGTLDYSHCGNGYFEYNENFFSLENYYPKLIIKINTLAPIYGGQEKEAIENFIYNKELFLLYRDQLSPSLCNKLVHGPENNHILDDSVIKEILMLNEKSIKNVERKIK